jgi:hypothetical protein
VNGARAEPRVHGAGRASLWWPLVVYLLLVTAASFRLADQINPDGVSYLRNARLLADGRFWDSVSGYWSPLLSWLLAPLLHAGIDSLIAARVVLAACGAFLLVAVWGLMNLLAAPAAPWRAAMMTVIALNAVPWTFLITPDVLLAGCLFVYGLGSLTPELAVRPARAWRCGIAAGVAFLAKAYALPFFLVHFPLALALSCWEMRRTGGAARRSCRAATLMAAGAGLLGFVMIAGPWMAVLSVKYGRPMATASAAFNHARVNPSLADRPVYEDRLIEPLPGKVSIWDTPEALVFRDWSPFHSWTNAAAQFRVIVNGLSVLGHSFDALRLTIVLLAASPALAILCRRDPRELHRLLWGLGTVIIYCAGYLLVPLERRYIMPFVLPIGLGLCATYASLGLNALRTSAPRYLPVAGPLAALLIVGSFGYRGPRDALPMVIAGTPRTYRQVGQRLRQLGVSGPIASDRWSDGLYVAYHAGLPYLGNVDAADRLTADQARRLSVARVFVQWNSVRDSDDALVASGWRPLIVSQDTADRATVWVQSPSRQVR